MFVVTQCAGKGANDLMWGACRPGMIFVFFVKYTAVSSLAYDTSVKPVDYTSL